MHKEQIRGMLPEECRPAFDDITESRVLGASRHIRMIGDMMTAIAKGGGANKFAACRALAEFFKETRGRSSYAFVLAMNLMTRGFSDADGPDAGEVILAAVNGYFAQAEKNTAKVVDYACRLAVSMGSILVYDYSSTVERFVTALPAGRNVIVPESRAIDGGRPFVQPFVDAGHAVRFIPDAAMLTLLPQVDAAFIGVETYYPDGTVFNTVGSDILAELCQLCRVPCYALTPLVKLDMRAAKGVYKQTVEADLGSRLAAGWPQQIREAVDFNSIELVGVAPRLITAIVTEEGILPPAAMYAVAKRFDETINTTR